MLLIFVLVLINTAQYSSGCGHGAQPEQCLAPIDQSVEKWLYNGNSDGCRTCN